MIGKILLPVCAIIMLISPSAVPSQEVKWQPQQVVPEWFDPSIAPYAGLTSIGPAGPYIRYNPEIWYHLPWYMRAFLRAHEYGHIHSKGPFANSEANADCWAARQLARSDPQVIELVISFMSNVMGPRGGDLSNGSGFQMAQVVCQCSGKH